MLEAVFEKYTDMIICIHIYIYLKLLLIDIKSFSHIHEFYTSKRIHIVLTTVFVRPPGPVYGFLLFYAVSDGYAYRTYDMAIVWESVNLYK